MIIQLVTSFIFTAAFAVIFNVPFRNLIQCGLIGMIGWTIYISFMKMNEDPIMATFVAAFFVTVISQIFARIYKTPIIVFSVSGIILLVPGLTAYNAMKSAVENQYDLAVQFGAKAFMISGAIAFGLVLSEVINQFIKRSKL